MEGPTADEQDLYDQSFIEVPAILDKHKAAAEVCQGKYSILIVIIVKTQVLISKEMVKSKTHL